MTSAATYWTCQCGVQVPMGCSHKCAHIGPTPGRQITVNPPWPADLIDALTERADKAEATAATTEAENRRWQDEARAARENELLACEQRQATEAENRELREELAKYRANPLWNVRAEDAAPFEIAWNELTAEEVDELRELLAERRETKRVLAEMVKRQGTASASAGSFSKMIDPYNP